MQLKIRDFILPVLFMLSIAGCKEEYYPAIDRHMGAIVVEGLMTNLKEPYKVKLSMAVPFDSAVSNTGILAAIVFIKDDLGNIYPMHEEHNLKYYYSDPSEFVAVVGRSYTLHIEMPDGEVYESSAQRLLPPATIDSIHGITHNKEYWFKDQLGKITSTMVYGAESFMDVSYTSDSIVQFRSGNTLMKCYSYLNKYTPEMILAGVPFPPPRSCPGTVCPYLIYNWKKFDLNTDINLSVTTHNFSVNKMKNSPVCFFALDTSSFKITYKQDSCGHDSLGRFQCAVIRQPAGPEGKILGTRLYALNQVSALYYQELNKQLSADGKLFDPIAVQLKGNIKCLSHPDKPALGLFEVSSCTPGSYWLNFKYDAGYIRYYPVKDISGLPETGSDKVLPDFWMLNFP